MANNLSRRRLLTTFATGLAGLQLGPSATAHWTPPIMSWREWSSYDGLGLAELISNGDASVMEIAEQTMHAVHKINPTTNAVLEFYYDKLAHTASDPPAGGIFRGVPFFFKDVGEAEKGRVSEWGRKDWLARRVEVDTAYIRHLRQAGLNFLGRTAAPEMGTSPVTESLMNGYTHNPWKLGFTPGGSSGGAGSAVASGILPMAAANDGGGSTRIPASLCGNVGLKYTRAIARTLDGNQDPLSMVSVGVNTRSIRDTAAFLDAALNPRQTNGAPGAPGSYLAASREPTGPLKIAVSNGRWGDYQAPADALKAMQRVAETLTELGHTVDFVEADLDYRSFYRAFQVFWTASARARLSPAELAKLDEPPAEDDFSALEPVTQLIYNDGKKWTWSDYQWAIEVNRKCTEALNTLFASWDFWLTPTVGTHTPPVGSKIALSYARQSVEDWWSSTWAFIPYTPLCNFTGHPAISLPVAKFVDGMPLGAHFMGANNSEATMLALAGQLEQALPWFDDNPPFHVSRL